MFVIAGQPQFARGSTASYSTLAFKTFVKGNHSLTVYRSSSGVVSYSRNGSTLTLIKGKENIFSYSTRKFGKTFEFYFKVDPFGGYVKKVGLISFIDKAYFNEKCDEKTHLEKIAKQIKEIASFNAEFDLESNFDPKCAENLVKSKNLLLRTTLNDYLTPQDSYFIKCLNSPKAMERIGKIPALRSTLPSMLNKYFEDLKNAKDGKLNLKIACEPADANTRYNAKYDDKNNSIVFPTKDGALSISECQRQDSVLQHEYMHRLGLKNEKQVGMLDVICGEANDLEGLKEEKCSSQFSMKQCIDNPDSCNQSAVPEAIRQAVSQEAKKDREVAVPTLKEEVRNIKLENVALEAPSKVAPVQVASNISGRNGSGVTSQESDFFSTGASKSSAYSYQSIGSVMQNNFNKVASIADKAIAATVTPAVAATEAFNSDSKVETKTHVRFPASSSGVEPDEYIAEEIVADKFGTTVENVRKLSNSTVDAQPGISYSPETSVSTELGSGGSVNANSTSVASQPLPSRSSNKKSVNDKPKRRVASIPEVDPLFRQQEIMGDNYSSLSQRYSDRNFVQSMEQQNIRIEIIKLKTSIGSQLPDATIFVDTGRSLLRKKH
ncbi:MAG: hypothetical protein OM95_08005 [Bdellovibrio sp. ArHS]|nr:MAG: hypothetical protein OM95_08005 [Bdellovibrio sp. ArHS]